MKFTEIILILHLGLTAHVMMNLQNVWNKSTNQLLILWETFILTFYKFLVFKIRNKVNSFEQPKNIELFAHILKIQEWYWKVHLQMKTNMIEDDQTLYFMYRFFPFVSCCEYFFVFVRIDMICFVDFNKVLYFFMYIFFCKFSNFCFMHWSLTMKTKV